MASADRDMKEPPLEDHPHSLALISLDRLDLDRDTTPRSFFSHVMHFAVVDEGVGEKEEVDAEGFE